MIKIKNTKLFKSGNWKNFPKLRSVINRKPLDMSNLDLSNSDLSDSNLSDFDLSYSDLSYSNLSKSSLIDSNLRFSNLSGSDLSNSNLISSDLSKSDLSYSDLSNSNLRSCNLTDANLTGTKTIMIVLGKYTCYVQADNTRIGCEYHSNEQWLKFTDDEISEMAINALEWWNKYKHVIKFLINESKNV